MIGNLCPLYSQGYIIPNGITFFGFDGFGYQTQVIQNPTNSDYTGFDFVPNGKTPPSSHYVNTFFTSTFTDEGLRIFLVFPNQPISLQPILSNAYAELLYPNNNVFANGVPFYLGFYTGYNPWVIIDGQPVYTGIYSNPVFGWGKFVNNQGAIQMLDSALEIEGGGIIAGTQTIIPVPEPSTLALVVLCSVSLGLRHWHSRNLKRRQ